MKLKKLLSTALALSLALSLAVPTALAEDDGLSPSLQNAETLPETDSDPGLIDLPPVDEDAEKDKLLAEAKVRLPSDRYAELEAEAPRLSLAALQQRYKAIQEELASTVPSVPSQDPQAGALPADGPTDGNPKDDSTGGTSPGDGSNPTDGDSSNTGNPSNEGGSSDNSDSSAEDNSNTGSDSSGEGTDNKGNSSSEDNPVEGSGSDAESGPDTENKPADEDGSADADDSNDGNTPPDADDSNAGDTPADADTPPVEEVPPVEEAEPAAEPEPVPEIAAVPPVMMPAVTPPAMLAAAASNTSPIEVTISNLYDVQVNPYEMRIAIPDGSGYSSDSLVSAPCLITSKTSSQLKVTATATATPTGGVTLVGSSARSLVKAPEERKMFLFLELQNLGHSSSLSSLSWQDAASFRAEDTAVVIPPSPNDSSTASILMEPGSAASPSYAAFKIGGDCSEPSYYGEWQSAQSGGQWVDGVWQNVETAQEDGVKIHIVFTFASQDTYTITLDLRHMASQTISGYEITADGRSYSSGSTITKVKCGEDFVLNISIAEQDNWIITAVCARSTDETGQDVYQYFYDDMDYAKAESAVTVTIPAYTYKSGDALVLGIFVI